ncbi:hypothetical protein JZ751_010335 [Albula glossodonta]|uniref:Uncharacterized protein n=1 Tax=Albula glossodonta TaxID=121402 RepID=A0A8T2NYY7_9TELE|nr:hypothetical protein JZ751_010335 [Albula glossodonta]
MIHKYIRNSGGLIHTQVFKEVAGSQKSVLDKRKVVETDHLPDVSDAKLLGWVQLNERPCFVVPPPPDTVRLSQEALSQGLLMFNVRPGYALR